MTTENTSSFIGTLDGLCFELVSSSSSVVSKENATRFFYREQYGIIWGDYTGGVVRTGRFIAHREGSVMDVYFVHQYPEGNITKGRSKTTITRNEQGLLVLDESYSFEDGVEHTSQCIQVI